ncbi:bifunctional 2-C-methyl-D-erythritol 4-phosphate cytidylyltransferase/2-C-methyl-D-erythritol 2,4-cyclodiphosphate synthase [uncultured Litoreibacter sp.]|uniref:bifunctional 2-C-methyl-D-erythritol 4-phosphate cytidylyltransferase/2-C-methyl-D-erythritol 2,4-cyclodiphosphate synthase n=1 Tax=uncultured Litoreibacter sp. TaxID=1392394 RepID=UPI00260AC3CB|nr:bifunctional 2-C-methyl-D-erythritol 4-phosphate cytidylyltransferase/2-C-methyl-D-erythritol 2,4-cyclodiphosphate synthase [uncultured Litoreibacter sp.]
MNSNRLSVAAVIVAAGRGTRAGGEIAKQWQPLAGRRVIDWTCEAFTSHSAVDEVVLVVPQDTRDAALPLGVQRVFGGDSRDKSVLNGLKAIEGRFDVVLIHDGARPLVSSQVIDAVLKELSHAEGAAPALQVTDALWRGEDGLVAGTQDREGLYRAQTPQGFHLPKILAAHHAHGGGAADDVEIARAAGLSVSIVTGAERNMKITTPEDFARAENYMESAVDIRVGNGFDVHRFGEGTHVVLCGIEVPHSRGLQGHSDADVGLHTITDAIYGALAQGDIGQHFPPSDPQWKGMASHVFLEHARDMAADMGFKISHVDCTLICEEPKIGPHALAMREKLSNLLNISLDRVSVKATTSEQLGFTGRREGIACMATATLMKG